MSTVKIKTEPTAAAVAVDVQGKLEPSLSTADIKLEQHASDIDNEDDYIKSESDSDEYDIKSESGDDDEDTDQDQFTITPKKQRQLICEYPGCGRRFNYSDYLKRHQNEHRLQAEIYVYGKIYILARQSLDDQWPCPTPGCETMSTAVDGVCKHIRQCHGITMGQLRHHLYPAKNARSKLYFVDVNDFYVNDIRCGYHITTGIFICHECRLVPECLLTHLQQKHAFDGKSIDNAILPDSAVNASADPNTNQHSNNPHLAVAISQPYQQQHQDIIQGWLCVTSDCGYCGLTADKKNVHKRYIHQGEQISTVSALLLRLVYAKTQTSFFLITRIDQASGAVIISSNRINRHKLDYSHNGLNAQHENGDVANQKNETADASSQKKQWKCGYHNCGLIFNSPGQLSTHRHEHKREYVIGVQGATYTLNRQSSDDRWRCPIPGCENTFKSISTIRLHIQSTHGTSKKQKHATIYDDDNQQQPIIKRVKHTIRYTNVDDFYIGDIRCGYHNTTEVFICHECKLVPEWLLTHLQQKHGYDEKSIDSAILPESARISGHDPSINQHSSNSLLATAIREPYQWHHPDIVQGWLCVAPDCGYSCPTKVARNQHRFKQHKGEQQSAAQALVLRLHYSKASISGYFIRRLDTITDSIIKPSNVMSQCNSHCEDEDGEELVLSDYSDEDDTY